MLHPEQHYRWNWTLASPPAALWLLVSNTDRFNRDCGYPPVIQLPRPVDADPNRDVRRLRASVLGVPIEWDEFAFEWVIPRSFGVERIYRKGPLARMIVDCELAPSPAGGTVLTYDMRVTPSSLLGRVAVPFSIGRNAGATFERVFRQYDAFAQQGLRQSALAKQPKLAVGGSDRLATIAQTLITQAGQRPQLVDQLRRLLSQADDLTVSRMRPYAAADEWHADRRETLQLFLHATRAGLLDFGWELVCPHCRGAKPGIASLSAVTAEAHCDSCNVDFEANFDQSVELTFRPNPAIRAVTRSEYCVGGPQITPHIVAQQRVEPGNRRVLRLPVGDGRYRVRASRRPIQNTFRISNGGPPSLTIELGQADAADGSLARDGELTVVNPSNETQLAIVEHLAWTDQATTAAEVTSLQLFRDLFSREVLRPGERISVGAMTVVFTDLKNSTQMYQEIGDAPAFGRVLTHFELLKAAVAAEGGCLVKTMGDAVMAVFPRPITAVRAMLRAQRWLAHPTAYPLPAGITVPPSSLQPLALKTGIHSGSCLAINQNDRLDYFGTTVNIAARLCAQCDGMDLVVSEAVAADPEVDAFLQRPDAPARTADRVKLKGFGEAWFQLQRLTQPAS